MSQQFVIQGWHALAGTVTPTGNKNAALPILAAVLLTDEEVILENVPDILDVHAMLAILDDLGVSVREEADGALAFKAATITRTALDPELCRRIRAAARPRGVNQASPSGRRLHRAPED